MKTAARTAPGEQAISKVLAPTLDFRQSREGSSSAMNWLALAMLTGDRTKYVGLIFAISFSSSLITQQVSIFWGLMNRTRSQILDVTDADVWVMDPATQYVDEVYALKDSDLGRVRGVAGVLWAVPFFKRATPR